MKKIVKKLFAGTMTAAMAFSIFSDTPLFYHQVMAAESSISGYAAKTEAVFDGTWDGNYDKNYDQKAEEKNTVCFRPRQKVNATLTKRMYMEADVAFPETLIAKITKENTFLNLNAWLDYAVNTPTGNQGYDECNNVSGEDDFCSWITVYSKSKYNINQRTDGKETNTDYDLKKSGKYYIAHIKNAIEVPSSITNLKATDLVYNFAVKGVNISYDGYVVFDNIKLTDEAGKEIAEVGFNQDESDLLGMESYSADKRLFSSIISFNSTVTSYNNMLSANLELDSKYISNEKDEQSWRNTISTQHSVNSSIYYPSGIKMDAGSYSASAIVYFPKEEMDKAVIKNGIQLYLNINGIQNAVLKEGGWADIDWNTVVCTNLLGNTQIVRDESGTLKYCYNTWDKNGENDQASDFKTLPCSNGYYMLPVQCSVSFDSADTFKVLDVSLNISGDGVEYSGIVLIDDYKVCSSTQELFNAGFDNKKELDYGSEKADINQPHKDGKGQIEWYDFMNNPCYGYAMDSTSADITFSKSSQTVYVGKTIKADPSVSGLSSNVYYEIGDSRIASLNVTNKGIAVITGVKSGTTYLYATANGITTKTQITVKVPVLKLKKASAVIKKGKTVTIKATVSPAGKITYTSKNKKIATVTKKGIVKGIRKGKTTILVKANGKTKQFKVTVK